MSRYFLFCLSVWLLLVVQSVDAVEISSTCPKPSPLPDMNPRGSSTPSVYYSISPYCRYHDASADTGSVTVTAYNNPPNWNTTSNVSWINITSDTNSIGSGTLIYSIQPNNTGSLRRGTLTIADKSFSIIQTAESCIYTLSPSSRTHTANAETGSVSVTASNSSCTWNAASNSNWASITSGNSGTGNGTVAYSLQANSSPQRNGLLSIAGQTFTLIQEGAVHAIGKAIIITASGAHQNNTLFPRSEELTRRMYRALYQRGFEHEDIIWLNPKQWQDVDGDGADDGVVDNNLFEPETALNQAFEAMRDLQAGQQFVLHVHGHALQNQIKITRDYWLDAAGLQALLGRIPQAVQQIVIVDTCYSGSFLDELQGSNRIILTASDAESTAWNAKFATFSGELINHLRRGSALRTAFQAAEDMMRGSPELFGTQRPQLDDDGDGVYSSRDGVRAAQVMLGKEGSRAADAPEILQVHERLNLSSPEAVLWIKTSPSGEQVRKVKAVLMPPAVAMDNYAGEETDFGRVEIELLYNGAQSRFEQVYHFNQGGLWKLLYQVQGLDGTWSAQVAGEVQAPDLIKPATVKALLNQSAYAVGEPLRFDLSLNAADATAYDVYAAILFPAGYFVTIRYPLEFSLPGTIIPYQSAFSFAPAKTLSILDFPLPSGLPTGMYGVCGVVSPAGHDPWDVPAWVDSHCENFELR